MSKDSKTLSSLRQVLLDMDVNLNLNTARANVLENITFSQDDFIPLAKGNTFTLKDESKLKAITIMRAFFESFFRYKFFFNLETMVKIVAQKTIHRDKYEEALGQLLELRQIVTAESLVINKARTFAGTLVSKDYFTLIQDDLNAYLDHVLDDVGMRGSADTMLKRYILRTSNLLHYMQWRNQPDAFGEPVVGDEIPQITYDRCKKIVDKWVAYQINFFQHAPALYDVIDDVPDDRAVLVDGNRFIIANGFVLCAGTGKPVASNLCEGTVYGTFLSKDYTKSPEAKGVWDTCDYTQHDGNRKWVKRVDLVEIRDSRDRHTGDCYIETAKTFLGKKLWQRNDRWYNFDITKYSCYVMNRGWMPKKDAEQYGVYEEALGMYVANGDNFDVFPHNVNILDHLSGFKHMGYEEITRGHRERTRNTLFLGMELEVEMSNNAQMKRKEAARATMVAMKGDCIVAHDGTLTNGFEIISVPATLNYHYEMWKDILRSQLRRQIVSFKRASCGIHIHMSKEAFTDLALGKFMTFMTHPKNTTFIEAVAQRKDNKYNIRKATKITNVKSKTTLDGEFMGHYYAVNLDKPHTIEVRIFKGTLHYPSVMKNLEFCHALHSWVSSYECSVNDVGDWSKFTDFVKQNRKTYTFLYDFLKNHKGKWIKDDFRDISETSTNDVTDEHTETGTTETQVKSPLPVDRMALIRKSTTAVRKCIVN